MFGMSVSDPNQKLLYRDKLSAIKKVIPKVEREANKYDFRLR